MNLIFLPRESGLQGPGNENGGLSNTPKFVHSSQSLVFWLPESLGGELAVNAIYAFTGHAGMWPFGPVNQKMRFSGEAENRCNSFFTKGPRATASDIVDIGANFSSFMILNSQAAVFQGSRHRTFPQYTVNDRLTGYFRIPVSRETHLPYSH